MIVLLGRRKVKRVQRSPTTARLAEMPLRVLWEGTLPRVERVEVQDEPGRTFSTFVDGYASLPTVVSRK